MEGPKGGGEVSDSRRMGVHWFEGLGRWCGLLGRSLHRASHYSSVDLLSSRAKAERGRMTASQILTDRGWRKQRGVASPLIYLLSLGELGVNDRPCKLPGA